VLQEISDVTARVNTAVKPEMSAADQNAARRAVIAEIEKESTDATGLRSDVVTLYQGGQYNLYRYKKYTDVRLVFAPEFKIAFFGGDPDNFTYPRYNLDMAIFRVYENDQPLKVENFLPWREEGAKKTNSSSSRVIQARPNASTLWRTSNSCATQAYRSCFAISSARLPRSSNTARRATKPRAAHKKTSSV
jgi:hypothetical protein